MAGKISTTRKHSSQLCATPGRESNPGQAGQSLFYITKPRRLALNGKKRPYRTSDWAWKGCRNQKDNVQQCNTPLTPKQTPQLTKPPQTFPQPFDSGLQLTKGSCNDKKSMSQEPLKPLCLAIVRQFLQWKGATSSQHDDPTHKKPLKPVCLAIARLRPNESTALAMKESHLFPTWWANPQKTSETTVFGNSCGFDVLKAQLLQWKRATSSQHYEPTHKKHLKPLGNSAVSTYWKHSPCTDRGCLLSNYVVVVVVVVVVVLVVAAVVVVVVAVVAVVVVVAVAAAAAAVVVT